MRERERDRERGREGERKWFGGRADKMQLRFEQKGFREGSAEMRRLEFFFFFALRPRLERRL